MAALARNWFLFRSNEASDAAHQRLFDRHPTFRTNTVAIQTHQHVAALAAIRFGFNFRQVTETFQDVRINEIAAIDFIHGCPWYEADRRVVDCCSSILRGSVFEHGLCRDQSSDRHAERRTTDVVQTNPVTEVDRIGVTTMFTADTNL